MTHKKLAQETKSKKIGLIAGILIILFTIGINISAQPSGGTSEPQKAETGDKADQNLKSIARVNPSTLAMEMTLPLMTYPGRNGNSLPVGFSYSSKIWQIKSSVTWFYLTGGGTKKYLTDVFGKYADRTSAGWTSMMAPPRLDETLDIYNQYGKPFTEHYDGMAVLSLYEENIQALIEGGNNNSVMPCGFGCGSQARQCTPEGSCSWVCTSWVTQYCTVYGNAGNSETPYQNPDRMHYVKRVRVAMPDGSTHEFRKSDAYFSFCANNSPFNGLNCQQEGEDQTGTFLSVDGSGMKLVRPEVNATDQRIFLYLPNGSRYIFPANPQDIQGRFATEFIDADGNKLAFSRTVDGYEITSKWIDTMGREIIDPMPHNWDSQNLTVETVDVSLPGFDGDTQDFKMKWLPLKPEECETSEDNTCGKVGGEVPGALEDQSEILYYTSPKFCQGNLTTDLPIDEVLFTAYVLGQRSCNPFKIEDVDGRPTDVPARFNPVVLAEVELPNGKSYKFKYNRYGEISKIVYPSGSYETFEYSQIDPLANYQSQLFDQMNRGVIERKVYNSNDVLEQRWNYSATISDPTNSTSPYIVTTIAPHKSDSTIEDATGRMKTVRYLTRVPQYPSGAQNGNFGFDDPRGGMPYDERTYDESGALRARTLTEYIVAAPRTGSNDSRAIRDARPKRSVSIIIEGEQALATLNIIEYDDAGSNDYEYFPQLNVKETKSYPFVVIPKTTAESSSLSWTTIDGYFASVTPSSISRTDYNYGTQSEAYKARGIVGLPVETRVINPYDSNPNTNILAKTQAIYDNQFPASAQSYPTDYTLLSNSDIAPYNNILSLNCSTTTPAKICWQDPDNSRRGSPTTTRVWNKDDNTWIETHTRYDIFGNVVKVKDPIGNEASTVFSMTYKYAYPEIVITPAPDPTNTTGTNQTSQFSTTYDLTTGLPLTVTDDFGQIIKTEYNDSLLRPTRVYAYNFTAPETQTFYDDTSAIMPDGTGDGDPISVKVKKQIDAVVWDEEETFVDSFGRATKTQAKDSQGDVIVDTKYDLLGRVKEASNPYRQGTPIQDILWSKPSYDELGRAVESFAPAPSGTTGGSLGTTAFSISTVTNFVGTVVTVTDVSERKSRSITNALGQLLRVDEAIAIGGTSDADLGSLENPHQPTFYTYSPLGKMVKVQQGKTGDATIQYRYFKYDSLGRLIRVKQPEQEANDNLDLADSYNALGKWSAGFVYGILGNVKRTTDAGGVNIINEYDKASRMTKRCYTKPNISTSATECSQLTGTQISENTPTADFWYDGKGLDAQQSPYNYAKGKLTYFNNGVSRSRYLTFDHLGRLTSSEQKTPAADETMINSAARVSHYEYNLSGALIKEIYPSGRVVQNELDSDGALRRIYGKANSSAIERTYANGFSYTPDGRIQRLRLGNGRWESAKFNTRLQVTELALGTSDGDGGLWKLNYEYGELNTDGTTVNQTKNTGNIAKQTLSFNGLAQPFIQTFKYDSLYRLTEAKETNNDNQTWKQTFGYDRFGNRINFTQQGGIANPQPTIDANTNRFSSGQNFTYDKNGNLITDPQNREFTFNGENKQTKVIQSGQIKGEYFYDGEGKRVKKKVYDNGVLSEEIVFVYDGMGKLVAEYSTAQPAQNPTTNYTITDQLDSPRVITDSNGNVTSRRDFMPFGEELTPDEQNRTTNRKYNTGDNIRQKFTGYQKDTETNLDFAEARMYENRHGRFTAVDPLLASGHSANPQTFNRYVYVGNDPINITDPLGLDWYSRPDPHNSKRTQYEWFDEKPTRGKWDAVDFGSFDNLFYRLGNADNDGAPLGVIYLNRYSNSYLTEKQYNLFLLTQKPSDIIFRELVLKDYPPILTDYPNIFEGVDRNAYKSYIMMLGLEETLGQDLLSDYVQGDLSGFGVGVSGVITRDGDLFGCASVSTDYPGDFVKMAADSPNGMKNFVPSGGGTLTSQKIIFWGRMTREQRLDYAGGISFTAQAGRGIAGNISFNTSGRPSLGLGLGLGWNFRPAKGASLGMQPCIFMKNLTNGRRIW
jgi:RHS repeat-associated protein